MDPAAPPPDGRIESLPPATNTTPDGWKPTVGAKDETLMAVAPLTTATSSRDYVVGGVFNASMTGPGEDETPHGTLEVGDQIGCGIDMSTSNGVSLTGTIGVNSSVGILSTDIISPAPGGILPGIGGNIGGGVTVGLKPGIVNIVPVSKKEFKSAVLTRSTDASDAILAYYGATKKV